MWLKDARARLTKPSTAEEFARKSNEAPLNHSREVKDQVTRSRRLLYSSSSDNKSFMSVDTKMKLSPTVKFISIESDSLGIPPIEVITLSNYINFMNDDVPNTEKDFHSNEGPSCSYQTPSTSMSQAPYCIMKSTPKKDKLVDKIWQQKPDHVVVQTTFTLDDTQ